MEKKFGITFKQLIIICELLGCKGEGWEEVKVSNDLSKLNDFLDNRLGE